MKEHIFLGSLKLHFSASLSMIEKIIGICPDELWNKKVSGFIFWNQILHTILWSVYWLRGENHELDTYFDKKTGYPPDLENDPENIISKDEMKKCLCELKKMTENWFLNKDDNWLKLPCEGNKKITNFDIMINHIKHFDYHAGHCEAIFRDHGIDPKEYIEYLG